jgi:Lon-like ATP-dependent protease
MYQNKDYFPHLFREFVSRSSSACQSFLFEEEPPMLRAASRVPPLARSRCLLARTFWSFGNKDNENKDNENLEGKSENGLMAAYGDDAPRLSPCLLIPSARKPLFPGFMSTISIEDSKIAKHIVDSANNGQGYFGLFGRKPESIPPNDFDKGEIISSISDIYNVGTFVQIQNIFPQPSGVQLLVMAHRRITLTGITDFGPPTIGNIDHWSRPNLKNQQQTPLIKAYANELISAVREVLKENPLMQDQIRDWMARVDTSLSDPFKLADFAAAMTTAEASELQKVLESKDVEERLSLAMELISKEREMIKIQKEISKQVEDKVNSQQREYMLREQLKSIKKELGEEKDDKTALVGKFEERFNAFKDHLCADTAKTIQNELDKLASLEKNSPEFTVTKSYLEWLTSIPWGTTSEEQFVLSAAKDVLDSDHFGMDEVKTRILEFIAVGKLRGSMKGKIYCLIGPPGVGKTSIATSIAKALNRSFHRISVGGLTDVAEIKGHRRTYIGAMPGKPVQSLKTTGVMNPVILIDEIDKLGRGYQGDPGSALLELLDPSQNDSFVDHFLDVPCDFSRVLFLCTANDEAAISGPLRDRMEVIRLSGYDIREKVSIAETYLVPKAIESTGLAPNSLTFTREALEFLVTNYCRESGVRSLQKKILSIAEKVAHKSVQEEEKAEEKVSSAPTEVTVDMISDFIGKARFTQDTIYNSEDEALPPGVVMGLAWNIMGGSPIFIETVGTTVASSEYGGGVNVVTGQLGNVMKESVNIAYTFARNYIQKIDADNDFFKRHQLHLHVPEGAVEKDGPSAGVAMTTSLIGIALGKKVRPRLGMTGELSLTGRVLPVGGIKEKVLAARRSGADTVILPVLNKIDFDELPDYIKNEVTVHFVSEYAEAFSVAFPEVKEKDSGTDYMRKYVL